MERVAKAALVNEQDEILVLTRSVSDEYRPGEIDLPGGCVEIGEPLNSGVVREIAEEVGITLLEHEVELVFTETGTRKNQSIIRFLYLGKISLHDPIRLSTEHQSWSWQTLETAVSQFGQVNWGKGLQHLLETRLGNAK